MKIDEVLKVRINKELWDRFLCGEIAIRTGQEYAKDFLELCHFAGLNYLSGADTRSFIPKIGEEDLCFHCWVAPSTVWEPKDRHNVVVYEHAEACSYFDISDPVSGWKQCEVFDYLDFINEDLQEDRQEVRLFGNEDLLKVIMG